MKKLIFILLSFISFKLVGQVYTPIIANYTLSGKPIGYSQATPGDGRSMFYDATNFIYRPFQNPTEVITFLNLPKYRAGNVIYVVDSGGTLLGNGTYTNPHNTFYMFRDGVADGNLVKLNFFGATSGNPGTLTNFAFTNAAGITGNVTNPTTIPNLTLGVTLGGDISGSSLSAVTVSRFNGQLPSYYLNFNNLFNIPTIPAQFNPIAGTNISLTGSYPNITINSSAGAGTAGYGILLTGGGSIINIDSLNYRKMDTAYMINDSTMVISINFRLDT